MAEQTPTPAEGLPPLEENPSTLDLAKRAMAMADGLEAQARRDPIAAVINNNAGYQRAYLVHANALAAVATAEAVEQIHALLQDLAADLKERHQQVSG